MLKIKPLNTLLHHSLSEHIESALVFSTGGALIASSKSPVAPEAKSFRKYSAIMAQVFCLAQKSGIDKSVDWCLPLALFPSDGHIEDYTTNVTLLSDTGSGDVLQSTRQRLGKFQGTQGIPLDAAARRKLPSLPLKESHFVLPDGVTTESQTDYITTNPSILQMRDLMLECGDTNIYMSQVADRLIVCFIGPSETSQASPPPLTVPARSTTPANHPSSHETTPSRPSSRAAFDSHASTKTRESPGPTDTGSRGGSPPAVQDSSGNLGMMKFRARQIAEHLREELQGFELP